MVSVLCVLCVKFLCIPPQVQSFTLWSNALKVHSLVVDFSLPLKESPYGKSVGISLKHKASTKQLLNLLIAVLVTLHTINWLRQQKPELTLTDCFMLTHPNESVLIDSLTSDWWRHDGQDKHGRCEVLLPVSWQDVLSRMGGTWRYCSFPSLTEFLISNLSRRFYFIHFICLKIRSH